MVGGKVRAAGAAAHGSRASWRLRLLVVARLGEGYQLTEHVLARSIAVPEKWMGLEPIKGARVEGASVRGL